MSYNMAAEAIQLSPTRVLLAYLNAKEIKIAKAAAVLKMDANELRALATTSDPKTSPRQANLVLRLRRHFG